MHSPKKRTVWASLITNEDYLPGILTLHHTLVHVQKSAYPFYAFYTAAFPLSGLEVLAARGIPTRLVPPIYPSHSRVYEQDPRFQETWTKLGVFGLWGEEGEFERIVLLDGDMLVRRGIDELMEIELDDPGTEDATRVFAACHACACNPLKKPHYPKSWYTPLPPLPTLEYNLIDPRLIKRKRTPQNCAYTTQHLTPDLAQTTPPAPTTGVSMLNSGLLVVRPARDTWALIESALHEPARLARYDFPDQELLSDVFRGRWVALPYVFNALKTLRWPAVHGAIWRDHEVRLVHYIFARKPWHQSVPGPGPHPGPSPSPGYIDETHRWWWEANKHRQVVEHNTGIE